MLKYPRKFLLLEVDMHQIQVLLLNIHTSNFKYDWIKIRFTQYIYHLFIL